MSGKILRAHIDSFKGVSDVDIDFQDKKILGLIADGNKGKTSIIEFFKSGLSGIIEDHNINNVTKKAAGNIVFEQDGTIWTVKFSKTKKTETVKVLGSNKMKGGKEALREIVGSIAIDPFAIQRMKPEAQEKEFKKLIRLDTSPLDAEIKELETERTMIGREVKTLEGSIKADPNNVIDLEAHLAKYAEELPMGTRKEDLQKAIDANNLLARMTEGLSNTERQINTVTEHIEAIEEQIRQLEVVRDRKADELLQLRADEQLKIEWIADHPEKPIRELQAEIDEIDEFNRERESLQRFTEKVKAHNDKKAEYEAMDGKIDAKRQEKAAAIKAETSFVPGLEFLEPKTDAEGNVVDDREGPHFNGIPISGLSTTELVRFAIAFKRALDTRDGKKPLPVFILDDFERVGSEGRAELEELCRSGECQAIVSLMDPDVTDVKLVLRNDLDFPIDELRDPKAKARRRTKNELHFSQGPALPQPTNQPESLPSWGVGIPAPVSKTPEELQADSRASMEAFEQAANEDAERETDDNQ